jgi:pantetheine-phosphate adenylyltransferase
MVHAVYPGSFDPVTRGHMDIICRAAKMFDKVTVAVARNYSKPSGCFTPEERAELIARCTGDLKNVEVDLCDGLLADYVKRIGANVVVKGLRAMSDFEQEFQQALTNKKLYPEMETLFISSAVEYTYLSSSIVKQVGSLGGDITDFVPPEVKDEIINRIQNRT